MKSHLKTEVVLVLNQFSEEGLPDESDPLSCRNIGDTNNNEEKSNTKLEIDFDKSEDTPLLVCSVKKEAKCFIQKELTDCFNKTETNIYIKEENDIILSSIKQEVDKFDEDICYNENPIKIEQIQVPEKNLWVCDICNLQCKTNAAFVIHWKTHNRHIEYKCADCGLSVASKSVLIKHVLTHKQFKCKICGGMCYLEASLHNHIKKHDLQIETYNNVKEIMNVNGIDVDDSLVCKICDKFFTRRENLIFHIRTAHIGQKLFQCNICNKTLSDQNSLVDHIKSHSNIQCKNCNGHLQHNRSKNHKCRMPCTFMCEYCDAEFALKHALSTHRRIHFEKPELIIELTSDDRFKISQRPYVCHICSRSYKNRFGLRDHLKNTHGPKVVRTCEICNKSYMTKKAFKEHNLNVHPKSKKYKCDVCGKAFVARHLVTRHMLKHTGEKKYQCEDCGKFFQMSYTLKLHRKIHLDDKSFQCYDCGKKFITKGNLQIHVKTHFKKAFD